ncbi:MAG: hypothetical protein HY906_21515 [Deltaproteobacteria bacterium]|nr:hypothetical protein [Deltaproteobacteria bacterium]
MRARLLLVLAAGALALAPGRAAASPNHCFSAYPVTTMGSVGDSISCAFDSRDGEASTLWQYAGHIGWDWGYSWTVGDQSWSIRKQLQTRAGGASTYAYFPGTIGLDTDGTSGDDSAQGTAAIGWGAITAPKNGAKWDDAPAQAERFVKACCKPCTTDANCGGAVGSCQSICPAGAGCDNSNGNKVCMSGNSCVVQNAALCPGVITVELGGNDVCKTKCTDYNAGCTSATADACTGPYSTQGTIQWYMDRFIDVTKKLPAGTEVWVATVPDIQQLKTNLAGKKNFLFKTCQDLWNLNTSQIDVNLCDWGIFDWVCDILDKIVQIVADFVKPLTDLLLAHFGIKYPCWTMNATSACANGATTCRNQAIWVNTQVNQKLVSKFCAAGAESDTNCRDTGVQYGNVKYYLARNIKNQVLTTYHLSTLDCFHPSRRGQQLLAETVWNDLCVGGVNPLSCARPVLTDVSTTGPWRCQHASKIDTRYYPAGTCAYGGACQTSCTGAGCPGQTQVLDSYGVVVHTDIPTRVTMFRKSCYATGGGTHCDPVTDTANGFGPRWEFTNNHKIKTVNAAYAGYVVQVEVQARGDTVITAVKEWTLP